MSEIDLHVHTNISDGSETPEDTVKHALKLSLTAIAITDHDTTGGVICAQKAAENTPLELVSGLELGCGWESKEIHILGYDFDPCDEHLNDMLDFLVRDRNERNRKMAQRMNADGMHVDLDALHEKYPGSVIGRPHMAMCLIEEGLAVSVQDAFRRYLNPGMKYYIRRHFLTIPEAVELIRGAGGRAVIAHPGQYKLTDERLEELIAFGKNAGVSGVECYYSGYTEYECRQYFELAARHGLCATAGSDWHGRHKPHIEMGSGEHGEINAPYELLTKLREHE